MGLIIVSILVLCMLLWPLLSNESKDKALVLNRRVMSHSQQYTSKLTPLNRERDEDLLKAFTSTVIPNSCNSSVISHGLVFPFNYYTFSLHEAKTLILSFICCSCIAEWFRSYTFNQLSVSLCSFGWLVQWVRQCHHVYFEARALQIRVNKAWKMYQISSINCKLICNEA